MSRSRCSNSSRRTSPSLGLPTHLGQSSKDLNRVRTSHRGSVSKVMLCFVHRTCKHVRCEWEDRSEKLQREFPSHDCIWKKWKKVEKKVKRCYPVLSKVKQSRLQEGPSMCHIPICWKFHQKHHGRELAGQANQHVQNGPFGFLTAIGDNAMLPIGSCLVI